MRLISKTVSCADRSILAPLSTYQEYILRRHKWYKVHDPSADKNVLLVVTGFKNKFNKLFTGYHLIYLQNTAFPAQTKKVQIYQYINAKKTET